MENGDCHHIDKFSGELADRLIARGVEPTSFAGNKIEQHERYEKFYTAWSNWCFILKKLKKAY